GAIPAVHPAVIGAPDVAQEVPVDVEVGPRPQQYHSAVPGVAHHVAALGAAGTHAGCLVEIPGAGLVQEVLGDQRAHRAEVHLVAGPGVVELVVRIDPDV